MSVPITVNGHGKYLGLKKQKATPETELKFMVLNLANYDDWDRPGDNSWSARLKKVGGYILKNKIQVAFFSEVRFHKSQPSTKASYLNMAEQMVKYLLSKNLICDVLTSPAQYYDDQGPEDHITTWWEGLSTLSCDPNVKLITSELIRLPHPESSQDHNDRVVQYSRFTYRDKEFGCLNSHWSNEPGDRIDNAKKTLLRFHEWSHFAKRPTILVGDLNAELESLDKSPPDKALMYMKKNGWIDVWREVYPDQEKHPGYTLFWQRNKRVDYIWANPAFYPAVTAIKLAGHREHDRPEDYWSDHLALVCTIDVERFGPTAPTGKPTTKKKKHKVMRALNEVLPSPLAQPSESGNTSKMVFDFIMFGLIALFALAIVCVGRWLWRTRRSSTKYLQRLPQDDDMGPRRDNEVLFVPPSPSMSRITESSPPSSPEIRPKKSKIRGRSEI